RPTCSTTWRYGISPTGRTRRIASGSRRACSRANSAMGCTCRRSSTCTASPSGCAPASATQEPADEPQRRQDADDRADDLIRRDAVVLRRQGGGLLRLLETRVTSSYAAHVRIMPAVHRRSRNLNNFDKAE